MSEMNSPTTPKAADEGTMRRLRKLLTLASDPAAAPGEAANAMRMAQALMAKHGVTDGDITREQIGEFMFKSTKAVTPPPWESELMQEIGRAFGAKVLWTQGRGPRGARDKGHFIVLAPKPHLEMMKYAFELLRGQLVAQRTAYLRTLPDFYTRPLKAREADTFGLGFVANLSRKISDYAGDSATKAAIEERAHELCGRPTPEEEKRRADERAKRAFKLGSRDALLKGHTAAKDAQLNRGVA